MVKIRKHRNVLLAGCLAILFAGCSTGIEPAVPSVAVEKSSQKEPSPKDYLDIGYKVIGTLFKGVTSSGDTVNGTMTSTTTEYARLDWAVNTGNSGYIQLAQGTGAFLQNNLPSWTIETCLWIPAAYSFNGNGHPVFTLSKSTSVASTSTAAPVLTLNGSNGALRFQDGTKDIATQSVATSAISTTGRWKQFAVTFDEGAVSVYLDGVLIQQGNFGMDLNWEELTYGYLGRSPYNNYSTLSNTRFHSFNIYRKALSEAEIRLCMEAVHTLNGNPAITGFNFTAAASFTAGSNAVSAGAVIGSFGNVTGGTGAVSYHFAPGPGDAGNGLFVIEGINLKAKNDLPAGSKTVRIEALDSRGRRLEKTFNFVVTGGTPAELLRMSYGVNAAGTAFTGTLSTGETVNAVLGGNAQITTYNTLRAVNNRSGYISLGLPMGEVLQSLSSWTIELYVYVPTGFSGNGNMIFSFAGNDTINDSTNTRCGPTMSMDANGASFWVGVNGWDGYQNTSLVGSNVTWGTWRHIVVTQDDNGAVRVYNNGTLIRERTTAFPFRASEILPFSYCYLGRSAFHANGDSNLNNARYYRFNIYDTALSSAQIGGLGFQSTINTLNGQ